MNAQQLIVNIYHESEHTPYAVRTDSGVLLAGFSTIQQVADWLKLNSGGFTSGPKETKAGYHREAQIDPAAYNRMVKAHQWAEKKAA